MGMTQMTTLQLELLTRLGHGRRHGYALVGELEDATNRRPGIATVYAALEKLQTAGLVAPDGDEVVAGRVRRYFALTQAGASALEEEAHELARRASAARKSIRLHSGQGLLA